MLCKELKNEKLPPIKMLNVNHDDRQMNSDLRDFLKNSFPPKLKYYCLKAQLKREMPSVEYYLNNSVKHLEKIDLQIKIHGFRMSASMMNQIITKSRKVNYLILGHVYLDDIDPTFDFKINESYKITRLSLSNDPQDLDSYWINNLEILFNFLKAISECGLRESLKVIELKAKGVDHQEIRDLMIEAGLEYIELNTLGTING